MFFSKKSIVKRSTSLPKTLEFKHLLILGLAACIGGGIMTQVGKVIHDYTGAGIIFSYLLAGIGCMLVALPYCELAAMIPCSGGIYSYTYIAFGRFFAWIMFGVILGELAIASSIVSIGWSKYMEQFLLNLNIPYLPISIKENIASGGIINIPSIVIILLSAKIISGGMNTNKMINNIMVAAKFIVLGTFILFTIGDMNSDNMVLLPNKSWGGVLSGAPLVYFAFTGFTSLANAAEESKNPSKDLSLAIICSISTATIVYMIVSFALASSTHYSLLNTEAALSTSLSIRGYYIISILLSLGAATSMLSVIFACIYATSRVVFVLAQDNVLNSKLGTLNKNKVPENAIWFVASISIIISQVLTIDSMFEIASLSAISDYIVACILVLFFRVYYSTQYRPFVAPIIWTLSILAIIYLSYFFIYTCQTTNAGFTFLYFILFIGASYIFTIKNTFTLKK